MKLLNFFLILLLINHCSFDNKSGIWKNENSITTSDNIFSEFKKISYSKKLFDKTIPILGGYNFEIPISIENINWEDNFYKEDNNFINFSYNETNNIVAKSKKISKNLINPYLLLSNGNLIINDEKGNIFIISKKKNEVISKFNFYKKKYKKIKKKLNISIKNNVIYVCDNLGFVYALNFDKDVLWAQKYPVPFRSNLKIINDKIVISNEKNKLLFLNKKDGKLIKSIPTEETSLHNQFTSNLSLNNQDILYLNSYGSLYSVDSENMKLNWFINIDQKNNLIANNLFYGSQIVSHNNIAVVSSNESTYFIDALSGVIKRKFNFTTLMKPMMIGQYAFVVTNNNYLISININTFEIIYSYNINEQVAKFLNTKKKELNFHELMIMNNEILIYLKNSHVLKYEITGELKEIKKLPAKINSFPIISEKFLIFLDKKNKLITVN